MEDQSEAIAFLSEGASYGTPDAVVEKIETHISIVFLVGDRVFKLKRAAHFPYLDYSTVAKREAFCRKELELNRRTAPRLYIGVRAITRAADGTLAFDGAGTVLDWVIEQRRFPKDALFDDMATAGALTPRLMRDLSDAIVAFHAAAEITPDHGGAQAVAGIVADNDANLRNYSPPLDATEVQALRAVSDATVSAIRPRLDGRRHDGRVRRCHGDLHLGNVCLFEGRPTPFDCIEFNDALSCIDVLYDLAFLLMDLIHRDLRDLANRVFNRYLDLTGDSGGLPAMPLFLSLRAAVRAQVFATRNKQHPSPELVQQAKSYLTLAATLLQPHPPRLVAIGGLSGTGKSTVAQALASSFPPAPGARVIRSDVLRKRLAQIAPETKLPPAAYTAEATQQVYDEMRKAAAASLDAGYSAIADATFMQESEREAIAAVAQRADVPFLGIWLEAPPALVEDRIRRRTGDASDADSAILAQQLKVDLGPMRWHRIEAGPDLAKTVATIRALTKDGTS